MIIVEGPDGSGKTTLITRLQDDTGLMVMNRVVGKDTQPLSDLQAWVEDNVKHGPFKALYDRHRLISEPIYGPVLRGGPQPGFNDFAWLERMQWSFRNQNPLVIFCLPPFEVVLENVNAAADQPFEVRKRTRTIYWLYFNLATQWVRAYVWDYTQHEDQYPKLLAAVKDYAYREDNFRAR